MGGWWTDHEFMVPGLGGRLQLLVLCWMHHFGILLTVCEPEIMIGALMYPNICSASSFHLINMSHARCFLSPKLGKNLITSENIGHQDRNFIRLLNVQLYSVQCTVYSVQCTVYSVQCTVYT